MSDDDLQPLRKKRRPRGVKVMPLNLAPLIDINANLLFFLIIANSVQEDRLQAGKDIELPASTSQAAEAGDLISVVVGLDAITVNEREIVKLEKGVFNAAVLDAKRDSRIAPLYTHLTEKFQDLLRKGAQPAAAGDDSKLPVVLLQADKRLPYATLARVMRTCGEAGFTKFRFAARAGG
jgi:biopolymer transport protein ExbD